MKKIISITSIIIHASVYSYIAWTLLSCAQKDDTTEISSALQSNIPGQVQGQIATAPAFDDQLLSMSAAPPDSIIYRPVAWGSEIRILNRTIVSGNRRPYGPYWQAKGFVFQVIKPTRYQQDTFRERMVFADSTAIFYSDTFYICRKIIL